MPESSVYNARSYNVHGFPRDDTAALRALIRRCLDDGGGVVALPAGEFVISDKLPFGGAEHFRIRGAAHFATKIRQQTLDTPIFDLDTDNSRYFDIHDLELELPSATSSSHTNAYGIATTIPGQTTQGVFGLNLDKVRIRNAYRGFGINKSAGWATIWDLQMGKVVFHDNRAGAIYIDNPSAVGQPECTFGDIYVQNPGFVPVAAAIRLEGVEAVFNNLGIEDYYDDAISLSNSKEQFRVHNLHIERHHFVTVNKRVFALSSVGPVEVGDFGFAGTVDMTAGSGDCYLFHPGGGFVHCGTLYTAITNEAGTISIVTSGAGSRFQLDYHNALSGTIGLRPSWDTGAPAIIERYGRIGTATSYADDGTKAADGTIAIAARTVRVSNAGDITGVILAAGIIAGQHVRIVNEGSGSITFAAVATSRVIGGANVAIAAGASQEFVWIHTAAANAGRWYPS